MIYDYAGKVDLSWGYKNPKRKLAVATNFSEIMKQLTIIQRSVNKNTKLCLEFCHIEA